MTLSSRRQQHKTYFVIAFNSDFFLKNKPSFEPSKMSSLGFLTHCMMGNFHAFLSSVDFFQN